MYYINKDAIQSAWYAIYRFSSSRPYANEAAKKEIISILRNRINEIQERGSPGSVLPFIPMALSTDREVSDLLFQSKELLYRKRMEKDAKNLNWYKQAQVTDPQVSDIAKYKLEATGWSSADCKTAFGYDLCVFKNEQSFIPDIVQPPIYQVGIQKVGRDFGVDEQQYQEEREPYRQKPNIIETLDFFQTTIKEWLSRFGELIISSHKVDKTKVYIEMLKRLGFNISEHTTTDPYTGKADLLIGIVHP